MYFIVNEDNLIGKEVAYIMANQFCTYITIVTKDKGVFMTEQDGHETVVYSEIEAKRTLYKDKFVKNTLDNMGLITENDWEEYEQQLIEEAKAWKISTKAKEEKREKELYEKLKVKFE